MKYLNTLREGMHVSSSNDNTTNSTLLSSIRLQKKQELDGINTIWSLYKEYFVKYINNKNKDGLYSLDNFNKTSGCIPLFVSSEGGSFVLDDSKYSSYVMILSIVPVGVNSIILFAIV